MPVSRSLLFLFFAAPLMFGCQNSNDQPPASPGGGDSPQGIKVIADTTVKATVRSHASTAWCGEGVSGAYSSSAAFIYRYENCDEVLETLEVVKVREALDDSDNTVSAAFLRYSIGTKVFRDVLWFRQIGDRYARTDDRPWSYSDEEDWSAKAVKIAEEANTWEENSAVWYE